MIIERFTQKYQVHIVEVYKKGKTGKLTVDNIRLVLDNVGNMFNGEYNTGNVLCSIQRPQYDKSHPMASGYCGVTNLPMVKRPEFIGDLDVIAENVVLGSQHFKIRNYNYYLQNINSPEVQQVLQDIIKEVECFS